MSRRVAEDFDPQSVLIDWKDAQGFTVADAQTVEEFYRGKPITMLVAGGAGGGYDTYARIFARHLSRHIPGHPNIVAKNLAFDITLALSR